MPMKKPKFHLDIYRNRYFFEWVPFFIQRKMMWKDKHGFPRCVYVPYFHFEWLWFVVHGYWGDEQYWEQWLWIHKYHKGNEEEEAKKKWMWD